MVEEIKKKLEGKIEENNGEGLTAKQKKNLKKKQKRKEKKELGKGETVANTPSKPE
jgi:hypothetical protein